MIETTGSGQLTSEEVARYRSSERLRDGRSVVIRAIRPEDKGEFIETLSEVSPQSLYFRLFTARKSFSEEEVKPFVSVDFNSTVALVVVDSHGGADEIVGGGRYVRIDSSGHGQSAEVAFLVKDAYQGFGIGSRIFKHLVNIARSSGITQFEAEVLPSNRNMLRLFERSGLPVKRTATRDSVHVIIQLTPGQGK